ncbi:MAG: hypothetical protein COY80_05150 [Candidatus Pacebacteria bacterium CG_4_10_14_0_8_um_filter_42_14]|nr:MAG: hypothetical protein COY80_05150 [Candidatus Pacebacteria bacterium CG_4_10_14_0_8_um_filter_42_14]
MKELKIIDDHEFLLGINRAIAEGRHVDQLKERLEEYADYRQVLDPFFSRLHNPSNQIFTFLVTFDYSKVVTRTIEIHGKQTFNQFAKEIISSMGWYNDHMHGFSLKNVPGKTPHEVHRFSWYAPYWEQDPYPTIFTDRVRIYYFDWITHPEIGFTFDYGDDHHFNIKLIGARVPTSFEKQTMFPRLVSHKGRAIAQYPGINERTGEVKNIYKNYFD